MAKKAKGFKELLKQSKNKTLKYKNLERLHKNLKENPLAQNCEKILIEPKGEIKMSVVLWQFIEPYRAMASDLESHHTLFKLAIAAWNLTFLNDFDMDQIVESMNDRSIFEDVPDEKQTLKELLEELMARKKKYFAEYKLLIVDFSLKKGGGELHLSVASADVED
ncbi:hypothetical protein [Coleofasciculus sp. E2-BRE-01]|uniref:hypothetical protein n=1 Tax=Coleofasciculus sp. E2-BRE-01 TaxID=3069524 RepID=UPI0032FD7243